jgi:hypothetical protein
MVRNQSKGYTAARIAANPPRYSSGLKSSAAEFMQ